MIQWEVTKAIKKASRLVKEPGEVLELLAKDEKNRLVYPAIQRLEEELLKEENEDTNGKTYGEEHENRIKVLEQALTDLRIISNIQRVEFQISASIRELVQNKVNKKSIINHVKHVIQTAQNSIDTPDALL